MLLLDSKSNRSSQVSWPLLTLLVYSHCYDIFDRVFDWYMKSSYTAADYCTLLRDPNDWSSWRHQFLLLTGVTLDNFLQGLTRKFTDNILLQVAYLPSQQTANLSKLSTEMPWAASAQSLLSLNHRYFLNYTSQGVLQKIS